MNVKNITFRVDEELHRQVKIKCAEQSTSLQDYITKLIEEDLKKKQ